VAVGTTPASGPFFSGSAVNKRWSDDEFDARRILLLERWRTGEQIADLSEAVAYSRALPRHRSFPHRVREARDTGVPAFEVGIGHTTAPEQEEHMKAAVDEGVDLILTLTDTYTRKSSYERSQAAVDRALASEGRPKLLNGYPIVNYGVEQTRKVWSQIEVPVHISGNVDEEAMLSSEMGYASGATCDFTHTLHDLVQHSRDYPLEQRILSDQYIARLAAHYTENGAPIELLTLANYQSLIPPGLGITVALLSLLRAAGQGAKYFSLQRCIEGCLVQDVAAFDVYRRLGREYAERFGYDVDLVTHAWPWMGAWPADEFENAAMVSWCTSVATLAGVDWIYLKSVHEGSGIPDVNSNLASIRIARELRRILPPQGVLGGDEVQEEAEMIELEVRALLDAALEVGDGDPCRAEIEAVNRGLIDIPISAWKGVADRVVAARDNRGAVRYLNPGDLPLPERVKRYHAEKIEARKRGAGFSNEIELVISDVRSYMNSQPLGSADS
jgi:methylaspartate mutase epsilon subunit